ncbi:hypothetical protein JYT97_00630 [Haliea sp. AH-315-K21]|uniref:Copper-binding protein n=1 Tax=SAR86 cluster bacterium TaxID=2030880 RepID=A0A2A5CG77_9GAMM|nr:hypothetical protein [Haliea sp. AH-315-K21]PCJ42874.1 MAG: hypothetical protein COA71_05105 [SAR86 cluster bacterium]
MTKLLKKIICVLVLMPMAMNSGYAHHSFAMFDADNPIELAGTIVEWQYSNPHTFIILNVIGENGDATEWTLEGRSPSAIYRLGWTPESLQAGDKVIINVNPLHSGEAGGSFRVVSWEDGTLIDPKVGR